MDPFSTEIMDPFSVDKYKMDKAIEENDKKYLLFLLRKESILYESFGYMAIEIN